MLTFEQKQEIIESFTELTRKDVSMKRVNYHFEDSLLDKTVVVQHLHPNGNGFVYVAGLPQYEADGRGLLNIREATEEELRTIVAASIELLRVGEGEPELVEEVWRNPSGDQLTVIQEDSFWNIYHELNLEESFGDYTEATAYLVEEQFSKVKGR